MTINNETAADGINAQVIAVFPDKVRIVVDDLENFKIAEESLKVGSYLKIADNENAILIAIIENFQIAVGDGGKRDYIIEAFPLGIIRNGKFERGGDSLAIPPKKVEPAGIDDIRKIYGDSVTAAESFCFSTLASNRAVKVPINGNKFFNKHIAIVGSTGSGKSHTLAKIVQSAVSEKNGDFALNNSHVIIFDIHSEYKSAFPNANFIDRAGPGNSDSGLSGRFASQSRSEGRKQEQEHDQENKTKPFWDFQGEGGVGCIAG